jgi:hypothetical protein
MERQLWHLQDLHDSGGFGFLVKLFFLSLMQLISTTSSLETHYTLYIGTFRAIMSNWRQHKHSIRTQCVILNLICNMAIPDRGIFSNPNYPRYITDELLVMFGSMVQGQSGLQHINDAMEELNATPQWPTIGRPLRAEAIKVLSRSCTHVPSSSS